MCLPIYPDGVQRGVKALFVNGDPIPDGVIPVQIAGSTVSVRVVMG